MSTIKRGEAPSLELIQTLQAEHEKHSAETTRMLEASQAQETRISDLLYTYLWAKTEHNPTAGYRLHLIDRPCADSPFGRCIIQEDLSLWADSEECCACCGRSYDSGKNDTPWQKPIPQEYLEFMRMMHANKNCWTALRAGDGWVYKNYGASRRIAGELEELDAVEYTEVWGAKAYKLTAIGLKALETGQWPKEI